MLAFLLLHALASAQATEDPSIELGAFEISEDIEVNLFASEPMIANPIAMHFDPQGKLWVVCSPTYPHIVPGVEPNDFLTVLEDTDGDGRADKNTVFADKLYVPTGFALGDGGAYVANQPDLLFIQDKDGDGYGESRKVLLSGFGTEDNHHAISAWVWGPEGLLYFQSGIFLHTQVETPHGVTRLYNGGILQFNPRRLELGIHVESGHFANPWGHAFDRWGQNFLTEAPGGHIYHLLPAMSNIPTEGPYPRIEGAPKSCGIEFVSGDSWPEDWQGDLILNAFKNRVVCRYQFSDDSSSFTAKEMSPLIVSHEENFRPVDVKMGPDGALYVLDWYNPIIGHMQYNFRDPKRDHTHGRVWRITCKGKKLLEPPKFDNCPVEEVLDRLKDKAGYNRDKARRVLYDTPKDQVVPALAKWVASLDPQDPEFEHHRLEALWTYQTIDEFNPDLLDQVLASPEPRARAAAIRVLRHWLRYIENPLERLEKGVRDDHARVRMEAVVALSYVPDQRSMELASLAVYKPMDRYLEYALSHTSRALEDHWLPAFQSGQIDFGGDAKRLSFALQSLHAEGVVAPLLELVRSGDIASDRKDAVLELIASLGNPKELAQLLDPATFSSPESSRESLIDGWKILGPFGYSDRKPLGDQAGVDESSTALPSGSFIGKKGQPIDWMDATLEEDGSVDLRKTWRHPSMGLAYAWKVLPSETDRDILVSIGTNDGVELFVNGKKVHSHEIERGVNSDPDLVTVSLKKGDNTLLLKVCNLGSNWGFRVRKVDEQGGYNPSLHARVLGALRKAAVSRGVKPDGDLERIAAFFRSDSTALAAESMRLAGAWKLVSQEAALQSVGENPDSRPELRAAAVEGLGLLGGDASQKSLSNLTEKDPDPILRQRALASLVPLDTTGAANLAVALLKGLESADFNPDLLFSAFTSRTGGTDALAKALVASGTEGLAGDIAKLSLRHLYSIGFQHPGVLRLLSAAAGISSGPRILSDEEKQRLYASIQSEGDPAQGESLFRRSDLSCLGCHSIAGSGGVVGPDLAGIGVSSQLDYLVEAVLNPGGAVREGYVAEMVDTVEGDSYHGTLARETENEIILRDQLEGEISIAKGDIESRRETGSLMPQGLADLLTQEELVDLLSFLSALGRPGPYATPNVPIMRRWRVLQNGTADALPAEGQSLSGSLLEEDSGHLWSPAYSQVSGDLPASSLKPLEGSETCLVLGQLESTTPGEIQLHLNSLVGLRLWVDGREITISEILKLNLERGNHDLVFAIDSGKRGDLGLRVEVGEVTGSAGRAFVVSGR